ncbi:MAG: hypothetical protein HQ581_25730 [Planctomycetes bacterium]|nr:hypothetical protein [Planctomycetota bacterium]
MTTEDPLGQHLRHVFALFNEADAKWREVEVVGQHRKSWQWIKTWVRLSHLTNWRIRAVYTPGAVQRLWQAEWPGFKLSEGDFTYDGDRDSPDAVNSLLEAIQETSTPKRPWWRFG